MQAQYVSLFQYLRNFLHGEATFPYSFSKGLGGGMYGSLFYYLANPLNLLVYFFEDIPLFLNLLVIFKLSLCGLTIYTFLQYKFPEGKKSLIVFSFAYVLMNYNINYYVNLMWLDGVVLAPILLIGIERLLHKNKDFLYIGTLFLAIFFNYYIGYILTFFSVLYFGYCLFIQYGKEWIKHWKVIVHFLLITLLTGLMTSFILLPCALELLETTRVISFSNLKWFNFNFLDFIAPLTIGFGNLRNPLNYFGFCVFSGTCMLPLVICYFINRKIPKREKVATAILYAFFLVPILIPALNLLWHMFTIPMAFNYRYSFLTVLFTIYISYRSFSMLEVSKKVFKIFFSLFFIFMISLGYVTIFTPQYFVFLTIYKVIATVLLMGLTLLILYQKRKDLLLFMLVFELIVNITWIGLDTSMEKSERFWNAKEELESYQPLCEKATRCEKTGGYTSNDSLLGNYHGVSVFLTTAGGNAISFLSKASDYSDSRNFFYYHPDILLDTILGVEYIEDDSLIPSYTLLQEKVIDEDTYYVMQNKNALSLGYLVSPKLKQWDTKSTGFFYLEELLNQMIEEEEEYILSLPVQKLDDYHYELSIEDDSYPYLYLYTSEEPMLNEEKIENYIYTADHYGVLPTRKGVLSFTFEEKPDDFKVYTVDSEKVDWFKKQMVELSIRENQGSTIKGTVSAPKDATLLLTIPYEKGWQVFVDGKKASSYELLETFLAVDFEKGTHEIVLKYHILGLKEGIFISLISFCLLLGYEWKRKH